MSRGSSAWREDALKLAAAVELSRRADVVLLFLGLDELAESEV